MLDLVLVMLYLGSFAKFYYVMEDFLEGLTASNCHGNLTVRYLELMKEKFGTWVGGPDHRGRPTSVDVIAVYSNEEAHQVAIDSLKTFAVALESSDMALLQFKEVLVKMVASLPGIDLFYGQNLGLYLALCGYLKKNIQNAFLCFPIDNLGSARTIEEENNTLQAELQELLSSEFEGPMADQMVEFGFRSDIPSFLKTVRIIAGFCGIESRACWVECFFCDCIGPSKTYDWIFKGQSLFWLFREKDEYGGTVFVAREKKANSAFYIDVE
jgi:hypothetical protein